MKKLLSLGLALGLITFASTNSSLYAQDTETITFNVTLAAWYDLSLDQTTITFTDVAPPIQQSPGTTSIPADNNPVNVRVFALVLPASPLQLTVRANGDLSKGSGSDIGIGAITWTATGSGYSPGPIAMSTSADVVAGSWTGSILHWHEGTFSFLFARDYENQEPGTYTATATYTLSGI